MKDLDLLMSRWKKTDEYSPFLITKYIENRSILVYKKIKMHIRQGGQKDKEKDTSFSKIPPGPSPNF